MEGGRKGDGGRGQSELESSAEISLSTKANNYPM